MIVPPASRRKAERLLGWAKLTAEWADAPGADEVNQKDEERMFASPDWHEPISESDRASLDKLNAQFTPDQIAAAYLRLYRARHTAPEELSDVSEPAKPRAAFGPSLWFSLAGGHSVGAEPRRLLPMLCKMGNISREDVGAIRIQADASLIELRQSAVDGFLSAIGPAMTLEDGAALTQLPGAPSFDKAPRGKDGPGSKGPGSRGPRPRRDGPKPHRDGPRPNRDGPKYQKDGPKPRRDKASQRPGDAPRDGVKEAARPSAAPVDWNDDPKPRVKKPKGTGKPGQKKPAHKSRTRKNPEHPPEAVTERARKPRHGKPAPARRDDSGDNRTRGPKPPVGKPSSKKNRARKLAAKNAGGTDAPRRNAGLRKDGKGGAKP